MKLADLEWIKPLLEGIEHGRTLQFMKGSLNQWIDSDSLSIVELIAIGYNKYSIRLKPKKNIVEVFLFKNPSGRYISVPSPVDESFVIIDGYKYIGKAEIEVSE